MRQKLSLFSLLMVMLFSKMAQAQCGSGATTDVTESRCEATGTITVNNASGTGPFSYDFVSYPGDYAYTGPSSSNLITALSPGNYVLRVTDLGGGCFTDYNVSVPGTYVQPLYNPTAVDVSGCYNGTNGEIHGTMVDGRAPFLYEILAGSPCCVGTTNTTGDFLGLSPGTYNVRAYDSCGNFQTRQVTIGNFNWGLSNPVVDKVGCGQYSYNSISISPSLSGQTYKVKDFNGSVIASGSSLPISFSHPDANINAATVCVTDACGTEQCTNFTPADWYPSNGNITYPSCDNYTVEGVVLNGTPIGPVQYGVVRAPGDTVWSSSIPFNFVKTFHDPNYNGDNWTKIYVKDGCGVVKNTGNDYYLDHWGGTYTQFTSCSTSTTTLSPSWYYQNPVSYTMTSPTVIGPQSNGDFTNLADGSYSFEITDACGKVHNENVTIDHNWKCQGGGEPRCDLGYFVNYVSVNRRMSPPITYEQYDATFSTLLNTQTYTNTFDMNNVYASLYDWYTSVEFNLTLPNTTYKYIVTDNCGRKDTVTVTNGADGHVPNTLTTTVTPLCVNKGNITTEYHSDNPYWNSAVFDVWNLNTNVYVMAGGNTANTNGTISWNNLDTGTYVIKMKLMYCSEETYDTVVIEKYVQPRLRRSIAFSCGGTVFNAIGSAKGGLKPYQFEIYQTIPAGGEQPVQSSNIFTINNGNTYSLIRMRVIDACGNTSIQDMAVRPPAKPTVKVNIPLPQCGLNNIDIYVDSLYTGAVYEWRNPAGTVIATGPALNIPVTTADTGTYTCRVYLAGTCYDDTAKFKLRLKDFGCYAKLGNYVWHDVDKDGVQDASEVGVAGVTVTLYDGNNVVIGTTVTDAYGYYLFDNLNPGDYRVGFSLPSNYVFTSTDQGGNDAADSDPNTTSGLTGLYTLVAGDSNMTVDAGIYMPQIQKASLGDFVWNDLDKDGIQDPNELGVSGVTVTLCDGSGNPIATTVTDAQGYYSFTDLNPGSYIVGFSLPIGYVFSPDNQGSDDAADSDVNPVTGKATPVTLAAGDNNPTIDAGIYAQDPNNAALGNYVWYDVNQNGQQDAAEGGVAGVTATLYAADGTTVLATTTTDEFGYYIFNNLTPGDYVVGFSNYPSGYSLTTQNVGGAATNSDADPSTNKTAVIHLPAGGYDMTWDAGIYNPAAPLGALGNYVWYDYNKNGVQDAGEPGVPGVIVNLYDGSNTFLGTTTTNAQGFYIFNNLAAGDYRCEFTNIPPGHSFTSLNVGTDAADSDAGGNGLTDLITLATGEVNLTVDAGIVQSNGRNGTASLGDIVWYDLNQNGVQDADEQGVAGVTVTLYAADGTTVLGVKTTDGLGNYIFTGLNAGSYVVGFSNIPSGYNFTNANQGTDDAVDADADAGSGGKTGIIPLATGEENLTIDAGIYPAPNLASLGDYVWNDLNQDGVQDANEPGVPGIMVTLYDVSGIPLKVTTTDANGYYEFVGLDPDTYYVGFSNLPAGYEFTSQDAGTDEAVDSDADPVNGDTEPVTLVAGQNYPDLDAGIYTDRAGLGNYVWDDLDNDGVQDANEEGIPGITVTLYAADGVTPISTAITDANGYYSFVNLIPDTYVVGFSGLPAGATFSSADQGGDDALDSDADPVTGKTVAVTLTAGEFNPTIDAGIHTPLGAGLGNYVWLDLDVDGLQDANEPGVPGVTVILYDQSGTAIQSAITDQNGFYSFPNLVPGTYSVGFTNLPFNRTFTQSDAGNDALDSDIDPGSIVLNGEFPTFGSIPQVTIVAGEYNPTLDMGLIIKFPTGLTTVSLNASLEGKTAKVEWNTINEQNVQYFEVLRSINSVDYTKVATKNAKGETSGSTVYSILDDVSSLMNQSVIYYKIAVYDFDKQVSFSNVSLVRPTQVVEPISVYPIPFSSELNISYPSSEVSVVTIQITDAQGRKVVTKEVNVKEGQNLINVNNLTSLSTGSYFIRITDNTTSEVFIKSIQKK